jgi:hypothetical protein
MPKNVLKASQQAQNGALATHDEDKLAPTPASPMISMPAATISKGKKKRTLSMIWGGKSYLPYMTRQKHVLTRLSF